MASETPTRPGQERRSEPRHACSNAPAELTILSPGVVSVRTIQATIIEASKSGLRVVADTRMGYGQQVRVKMDRLLILAKCDTAMPKAPSL